MLVFRNPGLIELDAVRTMGVSVKLPDSFGFFGSGMKFAIATILRGGGHITIMRGKDCHRLRTTPKEIRGETFNMVYLDDVPMGITDQLGKNWEPWMVLRELGCNALDEKGGFFKHEAVTDPYVWRLPDDPAFWVGGGEEDTTTIIVTWDKLDAAWESRDKIFFGDRPVVDRSLDVEVAEGRSEYVFYRGIRALKLEHPSAFTYNVLSQQTLTEDRTIGGEWNVRSIIRSVWLKCVDPHQVRKAIILGPQDHDCYEHHVDWDNKYDSTLPSRAFMDVCYDAVNKRLNLAKGARALFDRHTRKGSQESSYSTSRRMEDAFGLALAALEEIFACLISADVQRSEKYTSWVEDPLGIDKARFVTVETLPDDKLSMVEDGRIYILRDLMKQPKRVIASEIVRRLLEVGYLDPVDILLPAVLEGHDYTRLGRGQRRPEPQEEAELPEEEEHGPAEALAPDGDDEGLSASREPAVEYPY